MPWTVYAHRAAPAAAVPPLPSRRHSRSRGGWAFHGLGVRRSCRHCKGNAYWWTEPALSAAIPRQGSRAAMTARANYEPCARNLAMHRSLPPAGGHPEQDSLRRHQRRHVVSPALAPRLLPSISQFPKPFHRCPFIPQTLHRPIAPSPHFPIALLVNLGHEDHPAIITNPNPPN